MNDKLEQAVHDINTPGLKNPETHVLTHNRFNTYMVLILSDLNKTQIYERPYRGSPHHEIEILTSFYYLNLCQPNEHTEDYHNRKPNDESFLFEIGDKKIYLCGRKCIYF